MQSSDFELIIHLSPCESASQPGPLNPHPAAQDGTHEEVFQAYWRDTGRADRERGGARLEGELVGGESWRSDLAIGREGGEGARSSMVVARPFYPEERASRCPSASTLQSLCFEQKADLKSVRTSRYADPERTRTTGQDVQEQGGRIQPVPKGFQHPGELSSFHLPAFLVLLCG